MNMTNREAINVLSQFACPGVPGVEKAINMAIDALKEKEDWLSIDDLHDMVNEYQDDYIGTHIWVKSFHEEGFSLIFACVLDLHYELGIVAIYGANEMDEWFVEKDYGTKWVAYLEKPV